MAFSGMIQELKNFDWNNLGDVETIGVWPGPVKFVIVLTVFVVCLGLGYWFDIRNLQSSLQSSTSQEQQLLSEYEQKAFRAANLEAYREQVAEMEAAFDELLRQLPGQTEVPDLVDDISERGLGSGLSFERIELDDEVTHEFYTEQPIQLEVVGNYHDFGSFVSGVASLPRIVTLHDFSIATNDNRSELSMQMTARTYRYRTESERQSDEQQSGDQQQ